MKKMVALLGGGIIAAGLTFTALAEGEHKEGKTGEEVTVVGELIDTACFVASDGDAKGAEHAQCASKCMATGVPAAVLPENSADAHAMMFLLTNPKPLAEHASHTIKVVGTAHPEMHAIDVKKVYVQQDGEWQEIQLDDEHHKMGAATDAPAAGTHTEEKEHESGHTEGHH